MPKNTKKMGKIIPKQLIDLLHSSSLEVSELVRITQDGGINIEINEQEYKLNTLEDLQELSEAAKVFNKFKID